LWGGIVNQSRNVTISALAYGPDDAVWTEQFVKWAAVFPHVARCSLRGEKPSPEVAALIGENGSAQIAAAVHMPSFVALKLADLLREACERYHMIDLHSCKSIENGLHLSTTSGRVSGS
jgi:putative membrane protein